MGGGHPLGRRSRRRPRWNANLHYDAALAAVVPRGSRRVLDVGTGDGFLAARLAAAGVPEVVALDVDAPVLGRARARWPGSGVVWTQGDLATHPFGPGSFDAVLGNAVLHHLPDLRAALDRSAELVRPGGVVAFVGFARGTTRDLPFVVAAWLALGVAIRVRGKWEHSAPQCWPPPHSYAEVRRLAGEALPGSRIRHLLYGRYLLTWTRPAG